MKAQTSETANFFGMTDRGRLTPGLRADVNLIDHNGMRIHAPHLVHDLPAGGKRLLQGVDGYVATMVAGETVFEYGEHTGALPGKLVRNPATAAKRAQPGGPFTADMAATRASREAGRGTFDVQAGLAAPSAEQRRESGGASAMGRAFRDKPTANATSGKHSKL